METIRTILKNSVSPTGLNSMPPVEQDKALKLTHAIEAFLFREASLGDRSLMSGTRDNTDANHINYTFEFEGDREVLFYTLKETFGEAGKLWSEIRDRRIFDWNNRLLSDVLTIELNLPAIEHSGIAFEN